MLCKVFNRKTIGRAAGAAMLVDLFGYAGVHGAHILNSNDFTRPASRYYQAAGDVFHFSWLSAKSLARDLDAILKKHYTPSGP